MLGPGSSPGTAHLTNWSYFHDHSRNDSKQRPSASMNKLEGPASILGGLPVFARCWFTRGDGWTTDDDCGVTSLHWLKRDGTAGKELSQTIIDRLDKKHPYWEVGVCEQVVDHYHYTRESQNDDASTSVELVAIPE